LSFSADTDIGECLVVGRKTSGGSKRATFVILNERPKLPMLGASAARQITQLIAQNKLRCLEDGPLGGTPIHFGDDTIGHALNAPLPASGGWNLARIADVALAQAAYQIANEGRVWLPTMNKSEAVGIPIARVGNIGEIGPYHMDVNGNTSTGGIRGPFDIAALEPNSAPTYPVLWSHEAAGERTMMFEADSEGLPRKGSTPKEQMFVDQKIASVWKTASHCHFNRDFRFNSQSTGMQFTPRRAIGGRAWLSIRLSSVEQEKAVVLWANTTLGALLYWWHANKQQSGRGSIKIPFGGNWMRSLPRMCWVCQFQCSRPGARLKYCE
jgi:hypothetical protein